jgi:cob(I)alamin adenosyltransferase
MTGGVTHDAKGGAGTAAREERIQEVASEEGGKSRIITSTKRGDQGETSLLSGERVSKTNLRVEACGNLDESSAVMGLAKALSSNPRIREILTAIQRDLLLLGSELSNTDPGRDLQRVEEGEISALEVWVSELQVEAPLSRSFVDPGTNPVSASLDMARTVVRRAERSIVALHEAGGVQRPELLSYVNRLGFLMFIMARYADRFP